MCVRVRAQVRDFYGIELKGTAVENPGWDDAVCGVLGALARLVGKKALHVPQVREASNAWREAMPWDGARMLTHRDTSV